MSTQHTALSPYADHDALRRAELAREIRERDWHKRQHLLPLL